MEYWGRTIAAKPNEFIFGYGSLISSASRAETEGRAVTAAPVRLSAEFGYVRSWNDRSPTGFTALGVHKVVPHRRGRTVNGVVYPVTAADLAAFDARELGYTRIEIPAQMLQPVSWLAVPEAGRIWTYLPKSDGHRHQGPDWAFPILQSYLDVVVTGGLEHGPDFAAEILETTEGWSRYWLNDRRSGRRPWVFEREWRNIDDLLAAHPSRAGHNMLHERRLPEHYAAMHAAAIGPSPTASHPVTDPA
jgi:cation transport regulator ChaC